MIAVRLVILVLIGSFIGWMTNKIALVSLFKPYKPKKILGIITLQGILPKRQEEMAKELGILVSDELINIDDIVDSITADKKRWYIKKNNEQFIPGLVKSFPIIGKLNPSNFVKPIAKKIFESVDVQKIVETKVNEMDMKDLEKLVKKAMKTEFKHIEIIGGILGAFIGLLQGVITIFI